MAKFISRPSFTKFYYSDQDFSILNVGYHDFGVIKPAIAFRTQKYYTWHFVLSGCGTLEIYDKKHKINAGQMFFIPSNTKMRYYPDKKQPWEYVWFTFSSEQILQYSSIVGFSKKNAVCNIPNFEKIKYVLKRLFDELLVGECGYFKVLSSFFDVMEICTSNSTSTGIELVKRLIDENFYSASFSIEQLCLDVGISHAHLLRLFKNAYGVTIIKYIINKRIELACELLRTTNLSVSSVAFSCGFSDEMHFMKMFKKVVGVSALNYRKAR